LTKTDPSQLFCYNVYGPNGELVRVCVPNPCSPDFDPSIWPFPIPPCGGYDPGPWAPPMNPFPNQPTAPPSPGGAPGGGTQTTSPTTSQQPCAPSSGKPSMGVARQVATVNPFTSGGGGVSGVNRQSSGPANNMTTDTYSYSGKGVGLDVGVSLQSVWAWGSGSWTGSFRSVSFSASFFAGSIFWTPGKGGWTGFSFGGGLGFPGLAYEETNYTCKSTPSSKPPGS